MADLVHARRRRRSSPVIPIVDELLFEVRPRLLDGEIVDAPHARELGDELVGAKLFEEFTVHGFALVADLFDEDDDLRDAVGSERSTEDGGPRQLAHNGLHPVCRKATKTTFLGADLNQLRRLKTNTPVSMSVRGSMRTVEGPVL